MHRIWFTYFLLCTFILTTSRQSEGVLVGLDSIIEALRLGDKAPKSAIALAKTHNYNTQSFEKGCRKHFSKIVNLGLPRTGTLSFIRVMQENFGLRSCHQLPNNWPEYMKEIELWRKNPYRVKSRLKRALSQCIAFADIPNYALYRSFEIRYPSARFILTTRGLDSWLNSTELLMKVWEGKMGRERLHFIKKFFGVRKNLAWGREEYSATWVRHTKMVLEHFGNRVLLLPIEFSDSDKIKALSAFTGCHPKHELYSHSHESHRSSTSNEINQFSKKCLRSPKKCGF